MGSYFIFKGIKVIKIVNKILLAVDRFMPKIHLKSLDLPRVIADHLLKIKKEFKSLKKLHIQSIIIKIIRGSLFST